MSHYAYYNEFCPYAAQWLRNLMRRGLIMEGEVDERSITDVNVSDLEGFTRCHFFAGIGGWEYVLHLANWPKEAQVWTGSCPCQPFSVAGKKRGTADKRHLWPDFHRLISTARPAVVFGEQVSSKDALGWFDGVYTDLESEEYTTEAVDFPACSINAPHIRNRLWWGAWDNFGAYGSHGGERERVGWSTPQARDWKGPSGRSYKDISQDLPAQVQLAGYPTPDANAFNYGEGLETWTARRETLKQKHNNGNGCGTPLAIAVQLVGYATPTSRDHKDGASTLKNTPINGLLGRQVSLLHGWGSPTCQNAKHATHSPSEQNRNQNILHNQVYKIPLAGHPTPCGPHGSGPSDATTRGLTPEGGARLLGPPSTSSTASTTKRGGLAPEFSRWLMGLPSEWDLAAPTKADLVREC